MNAQAGSRADGQPEASGWRTVRRFVAVDQAEARFAFVRLDVEADSSAIRQLGMATRSHHLARVRIGLAFQEELGDTTLQRIDLDALNGSGPRIVRCQLGDISLDSFGKLNLDLGSGVAHGLANVDAEIGERFSAVLSALSCTTSHPLSGKSLDLVVSLPVLHRCDLAPHLAHLRFEIAQHLEELPGFRPWQKRHRNQDTGGVRRNEQTFGDLADLRVPPLPLDAVAVPRSGLRSPAQSAASLAVLPGVLVVRLEAAPPERTRRTRLGARIRATAARA